MTKQKYHEHTLVPDWAAYKTTQTLNVDPLNMFPGFILPAPLSRLRWEKILKNVKISPGKAEKQSLGNSLMLHPKMYILFLPSDIYSSPHKSKGKLTPLFTFNISSGRREKAGKGTGHS